MALKQLLGKLLPRSVREVRKRRWEVDRERRKLAACRKAACRTGHLRPTSSLDLKTLLASPAIAREWASCSSATSRFAVPDGTGGANPGDRRAIFYLISHLQPTSVLEIGTHLGASTVHIAGALFPRAAEDRRQARLISVDIRDVNCVVAKPWLEHGSMFSPAEMIGEMGLSESVTFKTDASLSYLSSCDSSFDVIFLDGDHSAEAVYQEVPAALNLLNPNGVILLHDYFPGLKPLWTNGTVIPGPLLAIERLAEEGADVAVVPLGTLPWPTKEGSNVTSLALLLRK